MPSLPAFVPPMLARAGRPFDADDHLFEVKWDGTRALVFADGDRTRLINRRRRDRTAAYPELELDTLPPGTVLDGEVVVLRDGRPDFAGMLAREQAGTNAGARHLRDRHPAVFVAFDQLYAGFEAILRLPLVERRERLARTLAAAPPRVQPSEPLPGTGTGAFAAASAQGLEGVVAKRLGSSYQPGRRSPDWIKIKAAHTLPCAIVGWIPDGTGALRSLVLAAPGDDGRLRYVGRVGTGWSEPERQRLWRELHNRPRPSPLVDCAGLDARWVEPGLYCSVSCFERTRSGMLRAPVYRGRIDDPHPGRPTA